jgi:hypothetical protein
MANPARARALLADRLEIRIDALLHIDLDVGLGTSLDVRIIFG